MPFITSRKNLRQKGVDRTPQIPQLENGFSWERDGVCFGPRARPVSWRSEIIEPSLPGFPRSANSRLCFWFSLRFLNIVLYCVSSHISNRSKEFATWPQASAPISFFQFGMKLEHSIWTASFQKLNDSWKRIARAKFQEQVNMIIYNFHCMNFIALLHANFAEN